MASDLDGTLLDPTGQLTARTASALRAAQEKGLALAVASARPLRLIEAALGTDLELFDAVIVSNGACIIKRHSGVVLDEVGIEAADAQELIDIIRETWPNCGFGWEIGTCFEHDTAFANIATSQRVLRDLDGPRREHPVVPVHQLVMVRPDIEPADALAEVAALVGIDVVVTDSAGGVLEFSAAGADKGSAMRKWAMAAGFTASEVIAFGDEHNDIGMLAAAGHGVAMGGAASAVLAAADAVTDDNRCEGVAAALERLLNLGEPR